MRTNTVYPDCRLAALENRGTVANILALSCCTAKRRSSKVDVRVSVCSDQIKCVEKQTTHAEAGINAGFASPILRRLNDQNCTLIRSKISSGIARKQFKKAPNTTLPRLSENSLAKGLVQEKLNLSKYQPTAVPEITKLTM